MNFHRLFPLFSFVFSCGNLIQGAFGVVQNVTEVRVILLSFQEASLSLALILFSICWGRTKNSNNLTVENISLIQRSINSKENFLRVWVIFVKYDAKFYDCFQKQFEIVLSTGISMRILTHQISVLSQHKPRGKRIQIENSQRRSICPKYISCDDIWYLSKIQKRFFDLYLVKGLLHSSSCF